MLVVAVWLMVAVILQNFRVGNFYWSLKHEYIGCYELMPTQKDLSAIKSKNLIDCWKACWRENAPFFGLSSKNVCHCTLLEIEKRHRLSEHHCTVKCDVEHCLLASELFSVYRICPKHVWGVLCDRTCFCKAGTCQPKNGECLTKGCWDGIVRQDRCLRRDCSKVSGECRAKCLEDPYRLKMECSCRPGYSIAVTSNLCRDVNECAGTNCEFCDNSVGGYDCRCGPELESHLINGVSMCFPSTAKCLPQDCSSTHCYSSIEGYTTCSCPLGLFSLADGYCPSYKTCKDYPLCQNCHSYHPFDITCSCNPGYEYDPESKACIDIDECQLLEKCSHCSNYQGSFYCYCPPHCDIEGMCEGSIKCSQMIRENHLYDCKDCVYNKTQQLVVVEAQGGSEVKVSSRFEYFTLHVDGVAVRNVKVLPALVVWEYGGISVEDMVRKVFGIEVFQGNPILLLKLSMDGSLKSEYTLKLLNDSFEVDFNRKTFEVIELSSPKEVIINATFSINNVPLDLKFLIVKWFCTRTPNIPFVVTEASDCFEKKEVLLQSGSLSLKFDERHLKREEKTAYWYYFFSLQVFHQNFMRTFQLATLYKRKRERVTLTCKHNCARSINILTSLILQVKCDDCGSVSYEWHLKGTNRLLGGQDLLVVQPSIFALLPVGETTIKLTIFMNSIMKVQEFFYSFEMLKKVEATCHVEPNSGLAFDTKFTLFCQRTNKTMFVVTSAYCQASLEEGLLRHYGYLNEPLSNMFFSQGSRYDHFKRCLFIQSVFNPNDIRKVSFMVKPTYTYIPNFEYLGRDKHGEIVTLNHLGNAIEFLNEDTSHDHLEVGLKSKYRTVLLSFLAEKWTEYERFLYRNEIVKMLELLFSQPHEVDPFLASEILDFPQLVDLYKNLDPKKIHLDAAHIEHGHSLLAKLLSSLLYASYLTPTTEGDTKPEKLITYIMDNLNSYGSATCSFMKNKKSTVEETVVFTFGAKKISTATADSDLQTSFLTHNGDFEIIIPNAVIKESKYVGNISVQMVVFPYNPLTLANSTLFIPTVSVSMTADDGQHLPLKDFYHPVKIKIPNEAGGYWLPYKAVTAVSNQSIYLALPPSHFHNTLYKSSLTLNFSARHANDHRTYGFFSVAVCNGTVAHVVARNHTDDTHKLCYELIYRHLDFHRTRLQHLNLTLPPMLTTKHSVLVMQFTSPQMASVSVSLNLRQVSCQYWYHSEEKELLEKDNTASSYGCSVSPRETDDKAIVCLCYHLSTFSASFSVLNSNLLYAMVSMLYEESALIGIYTILLIWIFYFFLSVYAVYKDHKTSYMVRPVDLSDNMPYSQIVYMVVVETGIRFGAGCDGNAFIILYGILGKSMPHRLKCRYYNTLQKGEQNFFLIRTREDLGDLTSIRVWISDDPTNRTISWYIHQITVYDLQTKNSFVFLCDEWLAVNKTGYSNDVIFLAASLVALNDFKHIFTTNFYKVFENNHVWFSIFTCPIQSPYTRFQRTHVCLLNTHIYLLTTLILQLLDSSANRNANVFTSGLIEVVMTLLCGFMLVPVFTFITFMFSESRKSPANHIISDWNRNTSRALSRPKWSDMVVEEVDGEDGLLTRLRRFLTKKKEGFAFFQYANPKQLQTSYYAMHEHMRTEHGIQDDDDPYDNLKELDEKKVDRMKVKNKIEMRKEKKNQKKSKKNDHKNRNYSAKWDHKRFDDFEPNSELDEIIEKNANEALKTETKRKLRRKADYEGVLPTWFNYVAWILLTLANLCTAYFIVLLISWDSKNINLTWYLKVFATFCGNIFFLDPSLIIFYSFISSIVSASSFYYSYGKLSIIRSEAIIDLKNNQSHHMKRVIQLRQHPHYLHPFIHHHTFKVFKKLKEAQRLFFNIVISFVLVICSLTLSLTVYDPNASITHQNVERILFGERFATINDRDALYAWKREVLIEELYPTVSESEHARALLFSRTNKLLQAKHLSCHAITYPCFTRIVSVNLNLKPWDDYLFGPEWYTHNTYCLSYSKSLAFDMTNHMELTNFLNRRFIGEGFTFYLFFSNVESIAWVFASVFQAPGGGVKTNVERIVVMAKRPIPYHKTRVILSICMFMPVFAFFIFTNTRTFFYEGAGHYFSSIWNILDLLASFFVVMLNILVVVVLPGMERDFETFSHDTGNLQTLFYISGVDGIFFLFYLISFLSMIKLVESAKLNESFQKHISTILNSIMPGFIIIFKVTPIFIGLITVKRAIFGDFIRNYSDKISGVIAQLFEIRYRKKMLLASRMHHFMTPCILVTLVFNSIFYALMCGVVFKSYRNEIVLKPILNETKLLKVFVQKSLNAALKILTRKQVFKEGDSSLKDALSSQRKIQGESQMGTIASFASLPSSSTGLSSVSSPEVVKSQGTTAH